MDRKQPVVIGTDEKGELIWGAIPMPYWQMVMFPIRYVGDFIAHWQKVKLLHEYGIEGENTISADFKSWVPWQVADKYKQKRRSRGD